MEPGQTVKVHGTVKTRDGKNADSIVWDDTWASDYKAHRESGKIAKAKSTTNTSTNAETMQAPRTSTISGFRPKFDPFNSLLAHALGSALVMVLRDERYSVSEPRKEADGALCVGVSLAGKALKDGGVSTEVCFASSSNLLSTALVDAPAGLDGLAVIRETLTYKGYESRRGLLYPTDVDVAVPGFKRSYSFADGAGSPNGQNAEAK